MITSSSPRPSDHRRELQWWGERIRTRVAELFKGGSDDENSDTSNDKQAASNDVRLLERRMIAIDLDPYELGQAEGALFRHLQRRCMSCTSPGRCRHDLVHEAAGRMGPDRHMWLEYCPNAQTLEMLSALRDCTDVPRKYSLPYLG
jgi:hypothetical protein